MGQAATGDVLAGRYRLEEVIGRGGMSTVYRATDEVLGRTVAVKILLAALVDQDPTYSTRFEREARAAAGLDKPSLVTVYDTGVDGESHYIVMEYVAGPTLAQILGGGPLTQPEAVRIATCVADALATAHAAGILHRDIKPANVMLTARGEVKVLDFGIARSLDGTSITQVASVVGTAAYMAPERALGQPGDARADIYSLGCLLYAMLTGAPPFSGELSAAVLHQQINAEPRPPSELRRGISPSLDALVIAMLAKSPEARPASAAGVRDRLITQGAAAPTEATRPIPAATARMPDARSASARGPLLADHRRRAVVMAVVTALVALIAVALLSGGSAKRPAGATTQPGHRPTATSRSTPPTTSARPAGPATPAGQVTTPPGQGAVPPGKAKKHGGAGNANKGGGGGGD